MADTKLKGGYTTSDSRLDRRDERELTLSYLEALERTVGFAGRGLVVPTLLGLGGWAASQGWLPSRAQTLLGAPVISL